MASNKLSQATVYAPVLGENFTAAPTAAPKNSGLSVLNMLPGRMGSLRLRGPITAGAAHTSNQTMPGWWARDGQLWFTSSATQAKITTGLGFAPSAAFNLPANFGARGPTRNSVKFGTLTYGGTWTASVPGGRAPLFKWNGSTGTANTVIIANGPENVRAITQFASRLMVIAESPPGATFNGSNGVKAAIYWTDPNWDGTDTLASWQDDVSGLVNKIILPEGDSWHTLIPFYDTLYILGNDGILTLRGSGPSNWVLKKVSTSPAYRDWPNSGPNAIPTDQGLFFLSNRGIQRFDGVKCELMSDGIAVEPVLGARFSTDLTDTGGNNMACEAVQISTDLLCWLTQNMWYAYHLPTSTWFHYSSGLFTNGAPKFFGSTENGIVRQLWAADGTVLTDISAIGTPDDYFPFFAGGTINSGRDAGPTTPDIPVVVKSRLLDLGSLGYKIQVNRVVVPMKLTQRSSGGTAATVQVDVVNQDGTVIGTGTTTGNTTTGRKELVIQCQAEANAIALQWTITTNQQILLEAELHDAHILYQVTRLRGD